MWVALTLECPFHMWVAPTCECPFHMWVPLPHVSSSHQLECPFPHVSSSHMWVPLPHVSSSHMWVPLPHVSSSHTWVPLPHVSSSHTWVPLPHMSNSLTWVPLQHMSSSHAWVPLAHTWVPLPHVSAPSTCECPFHMWVPLPHMSCMWGAPLHHWGNATCEGHYRAHEPHMSTWAVCEGLPSTIEGMLHMRGITVHISHMWVCELCVRGSPPPLRECYTWRALLYTWAVRDARVCALLPSIFQKSDQKTIRQPHR